MYLLSVKERGQREHHVRFPLEPEDREQRGPPPAPGVGSVG